MQYLTCLLILSKNVNRVLHNVWETISLQSTKDSINKKPFILFKVYHFSWKTISPPLRLENCWYNIVRYSITTVVVYYCHLLLYTPYLQDDLMFILLPVKYFLSVWIHVTLNATLSFILLNNLFNLLLQQT